MLLLQYDPDINTNTRNYLPFRWACINGHIETVKWLISLNPFINISALNDDAFFGACSNGMLEIIEFLLKIKPSILKSSKIKTIYPRIKMFILNLGYNINIWIDNIKYSEESIECPICSENIKKYVETPCRHLFCKSCIEKWMNINNICPFCRSII